MLVLWIPIDHLYLSRNELSVLPVFFYQERKTNYARKFNIFHFSQHLRIGVLYIQER